MDLALPLMLACSTPVPTPPSSEPSAVEQWLAEGDVHLAGGRYRAAQDAWVQAALLEDGNARAVARQGWLEWLEGDLDDAIKHLEVALRGPLPEDEAALARARLGWLAALSGLPTTELERVADHPAAAPFLARLEGRSAVLSRAETMVTVTPRAVLDTGNRQPFVLWSAGLALEDPVLLEAALAWPVGLTTGQRATAERWLSAGPSADDQPPGGAADPR